MARKPTAIIPEAKIRQAIWYLKSGKTKKFVCSHIGIAYNTKRLEKIIQDFHTGIEREARLKKEARSKIFTKVEKDNIAKEYLAGTAQSNIAKEWYISPQRVKKILIELNVPIRARGKNKEAKVDHIVQDLEVMFAKNDRIFIAKYNCFGIVDRVYDENYIEYLESGTQRYQELHPFKPGNQGHSGGYYEPTEGIHFDLYWVLPDGKQMKMEAMKALRNSIINKIEETGREYYLVWRDDEHACFYYFNRDELYPIKAA